MVVVVLVVMVTEVVELNGGDGDWRCSGIEWW